MVFRLQGKGIVQVRTHIISAQVTFVPVNIVIGVEIVGSGMNMGKRVLIGIGREKDVFRYVLEVFLFFRSVRRTGIRW